MIDIKKAWEIIKAIGNFTICFICVSLVFLMLLGRQPTIKETIIAIPFLISSVFFFGWLHNGQPSSKEIWLWADRMVRKND